MAGDSGNRVTRFLCYLFIIFLLGPNFELAIPRPSYKINYIGVYLFINH